MANNIIGFDGALFSTSNISATSSFMVNNVFVMNNTSLGSSVVNSNIQSLGVLLNLKVSGNSTMSTLYTTNVNSNNLFSNVGTISTLYTGNLSTGAINVANLTSTNSNITTGTVSTLKSTNLTSSNANITTSTVSTLYSSTASVSNLSSSNSNITTGTVGSLYVTSSVNTNLYASCGTVGTLYTGSLSAGTTPLLLTSQSVIVNSNQTAVQRQYPSQLNPTAGAAGTSSGNSFYQFSVSGQTYGNGNYIYNTAVGVYDSWGTYSMLSNVVSTGSGAFQINPGVSDYNDYDIAANDGNGTFTYNSNRSYIVTYDTNNVAYRGLYLQIQLPSPINITGVGVLSDSAAAPRSMYVLASNNGTTWTLIYNIYRYITGWNLPTINIIPIVPTVGTAFNYYRFVVYEVGSFKAVHMGRFLLYDNTPNTTTLGVNTSNPVYTLDVNGVVNATNYKISGTDVLNGTTLGSTVVNSSLQNLGTLSGLNVSGNANITSGTIGTLYTTTIKTGTSKYNITLPNAAPTATNMVLATTSNSSNPQLVWAAANSLVTPSQWTTGGNDISYTTGNVGIGTASISPNMVLDVYGSSSTTNGALLLRNDTTAIKVLPYTNSAYFQFGNPSSAVYPGTPSSVPFYITNFNAGSTYISVVPTSSGATNTANIGINTATPNTALHVNGAVTLAGLSSTSQSYVLGYNPTTGLLTYQSANQPTNNLISSTLTSSYVYKVGSGVTDTTGITSGVVTTWSASYTCQATGKYIDITVSGQIWGRNGNSYGNTSVPIILQYNVNGGSYTTLSTVYFTYNTEQHWTFPTIMGSLPSTSTTGNVIGLQIVIPTTNPYTLSVNSGDTIYYKITESSNLSLTYMQKIGTTTAVTGGVVTPWSSTYTCQTSGSNIDIIVSGQVWAGMIVNGNNITSGNNIPIILQYNINSGSFTTLQTVYLSFNLAGHFTFPTMMCTIPGTSTTGNIIGLQIVIPTTNPYTLLVNQGDSVFYKITENPSNIYSSYIYQIGTVGGTYGGLVSPWSSTYTCQTTGGTAELLISGQIFCNQNGNSYWNDNVPIILQYNVNGGSFSTVQTVYVTYNYQGHYTFPTIMCTIPGTTTTGNIIGLQFIIPGTSPNPLTINAQDTVYFKITECTNTTNTSIANVWNNSGNNICYSSGNVGIGITNPTTALHVNGVVTLAGLSSASQSYVLGYNQSTGLVSYQSASAATQWTTSGNNIYYTAGNVGIGTNNPIGALTIASPAADGAGIYNQGIVFVDTTNTSAGVWTHAAIWAVGSENYNGSLCFGTDGDSLNNTGVTEKMRIRYNGNVGIGTTDPKRIFHIYSTTTTPAIMLSGSSSPQIIFGLPYSSGGNNYYNVILTDIGSGLADGPLCVRACNPSNYGTLQWQNASSGAIVNSLSWGGSYGYVGVGTNNPSYPFHVNSSTVPAAAITGGTDQYIRINEAYFQYWDTYESAVVGVLNSSSSLYVRKNGCVGVGIGNPSYKLHVVGGANSVIQNTCASLSSGQYIMWQLGLSDSSPYYSSAQIQYNFIGNNDNRNYLSLGIQNNNWALVVTGKGYVGIGTTAPQFPLEVANSINWSTGYPYQVYSLGMPAGTEQVYSIRGSYSFWTYYGGYLSSSDRRKKTNINNADTSTALGKILSLPLKTYNYIDKVADGDELVYGLIAQEVKEIMPEAITLGTAYIPSIYKLATNIELSEDETNVIITVDIPETSELKVGGKVELVVENMKEKHNATVVSFTSYELVVPKWDDFDDTKNVFVVGPEINDYHTLDKPYLAVVCMGGIQELSARNDTLTERVTALETTNATLQQQIATLNQLVSSLIDKVNSLSPQ